MTVDGFGDYIKAEMRAIDEFRKAESSRLGKQLSINEAINLWLSSGRADQFLEEYEARLKEDEQRKDG